MLRCGQHRIDLSRPNFSQNLAPDLSKLCKVTSDHFIIFIVSQVLYGILLGTVPYRVTCCRVCQFS